MAIRNAKRWAPRSASVYLGVASGFLVAFGLRLVLHPVLEDHYPFVLFSMCALLVEFFAGLWPALTVTIAGFFLGLYFFVPPYDSFEIPTVEDAVYIFGYFVVALLGIGLIEWLQRTKYEARLLTDLAHSQLEMLKRSQDERSRAENAARESEQRYQELASRLEEVWYMRRVKGNFEYVNDRFYECTGLAPGSLEGSGWLRAVHPEDVEAVRQAEHEIVASGARKRCDLRLRMADGSYRGFEGVWSCVDDARGRSVKWSGVASSPPSAAETAAR
jgi:PAS domain S-box-containing protein